MSDTRNVPRRPLTVAIDTREAGTTVRTTIHPEPLTLVSEVTHYPPSGPVFLHLTDATGALIVASPNEVLA